MAKRNQRQELFDMIRRGRTATEPTPVDADTTPIPLPVDSAGRETAAPCRSCGIAVAVSRDVATEKRVLTTRTRKSWTQAFARCAECKGLELLARRIVEADPSLSGRHGNVVTERLEAALVALQVIQIPLPEAATVTRVEVERLLRFLAIGSGIQWMARADDAPGYSQPFPFAYLSEDDHDRLRSAYGSLLAACLAEQAPPVAVTPPPIHPTDLQLGGHPVTHGCLMCGVGAVMVPVTGSRNVWTLRPGGISPRQLGGRPTPLKLRGYTCPACTEALSYVGAFGPSAMERALTVALGISGHWRDDAQLSGLVGWGALVARALRQERPAPAPNATPWGHLGDLDDLRERIDLSVIG